MRTAVRRAALCPASEHGGVACNGRHGAYSIGRGVEQRLRPMLDLGSGMEVLLEEGDLFVVDPMSASLPLHTHPFPACWRC